MIVGGITAAAVGAGVIIGKKYIDSNSVGDNLVGELLKNGLIGDEEDYDTYNLDREVTFKNGEIRNFHYSGDKAGYDEYVKYMNSVIDSVGNMKVSEISNNIPSVQRTEIPRTEIPRTEIPRTKISRT